MFPTLSFVYIPKSFTTTYLLMCLKLHDRLNDKALISYIPLIVLPCVLKTTPYPSDLIFSQGLSRPYKFSRCTLPWISNCELIAWRRRLCSCLNHSSSLGLVLPDVFLGGRSSFDDIEKFQGITFCCKKEKKFGTPCKKSQRRGLFLHG